MKVLVTGAHGFVGRWLASDLTAAGHDVVHGPRSSTLDAADVGGVLALLRDASPAAVAHLAAPADRSSATGDTARALRTHVGGAVALLRAAAHLDPPPTVLWVSSAEVYAPATAEPGARLSEEAAIGPRHPYGFLKLAAESTARALARELGVPLVVARPFPHIGPGQTAPSAVASFARRIAAVRAGAAEDIEVGNLDVERDLTDVRDVARAYRLLLELAVAGRITTPGVVNVASGVGVTMRSVLETMARLAGLGDVRLRRDPSLTRPDDPPRVVGDPGRLRTLTGWTPAIPLEATLADVLAEVDR